MSNPLSEDDTYIKTQELLLASSQHDFAKLKELLRHASPSVQDSDTGSTPLHLAIEACDDDTPPPTNGSDAAVKTVKLLLENGAIWNDLNKQNETPGCIALRLGVRTLYDIMVDAGVRAEILLNRLNEYEALEDSEDDEITAVEADAEPHVHEGDRADNLLTSNKDEVSAGLHTEASGLRATNNPAEEMALSENTEYLRSSLQFQSGRILDGSDNAVMMDWEKGLMDRHADLLCPEKGLRVLNIGHGSGWIDSYFQMREPQQHVIIEAHPEILRTMKDSGWHEKPGLVLMEGRWQDQIPKLHADGTLFDAIYFDTFAEDYKAFRDFFSESLLGLLDDGGRFSFFNGLGADRQICYDVYTKVVEMDLFEAGFDTEWSTVSVPTSSSDDTWKGVKRPYFISSEYKLPICTFL